MGLCKHGNEKGDVAGQHGQCGLCRQEALAPPLPKASSVCPVCGIAVPHAHDYAGLMTLIVKQKNDLAAAQSALAESQMAESSTAGLLRETEQALAAAQAENEKLREWQVRKNGEIIDLQGVLLDAEGKIERLIKEAAALRSAITDALKYLGPKAPDCSGCEYEWDRAITILRTAIEARKEGV